MKTILAFIILGVALAEAVCPTKCPPQSNCEGGQCRADFRNPKPISLRHHLEPRRLCGTNRPCPDGKICVKFVCQHPELDGNSVSDSEEHENGLD